MERTRAGFGERGDVIKRGKRSEKKGKVSAGTVGLQIGSVGALKRAEKTAVEQSRFV